MNQRAERWKVQRDILIVSFALAGGVYELTLGGARTSALAFLTGLLLSPVAFRIDEARKRSP